MDEIDEDGGNEVAVQTDDIGNLFQIVVTNGG